MSERYLIRDIYDVETDGADWPAGLSDEEKAALTEIVLGVLRDCVPLHTGDLYRRRDTTVRIARDAAEAG